MAFYINPENALLKAKELSKVGQDEAALDTLNNILGSRRSRTWQATHEKIMEVYVELSVKLRKPVRDAMVKYRNICQETNSASLETIITLYRQTAEKAAQDAKELAASKNLEEEDADFEESPGSIMLQAVSGESAKDRKDQQILTPWVKYLWEAYRTVLELLRNNSRLQHVYQATARAAFKYSKDFKRPVEFRRLCEMLRKHLVTIAKYQHQTNSVDLKSPETQRQYLETRFQQLEIASDLELWQEAYRTIEDIHESMNNTQTPQTPSLMKVYYKQLAQIFWASENFLFHAYSLSKFYHLRCNEGLEGEEKIKLASSVLLATLAIPPTRPTDNDSLLYSDNEENLRLASMLGFRKETPTRQRLVEGLVQRGILSEVSEDVRNVYTLTEVTFAPLKLTSSLLPIFKKLEDDIEASGKYVLPMHTLIVLRILQQLSTVYKSMKINKLQALLPEMHFHKLQRIIMVAVRKGEMQISIDHQKQLLQFGDQGMEDTRLRNQLTELAHRLKKVTDRITPSTTADKARERRHVFASVDLGVRAEHEEVFKRKQEIEIRKQANEKKAQEKQAAEKARKDAAEKARTEEEAARLAAESKKREEDRVKREQEQQELQAKKDLAAKLNKQINEQQTTMGGKTTTKLKKLQQLTDNVQTVDKAAIVKAQAEVLQQQKLEAERRLKDLAKKADYLVRAIRLEETPLRKKFIEDQQVEEKETFEADHLKFSAVHKKAHERALLEKARLTKMNSDAKGFFANILAARTEKYTVLKKARDEKVAKLTKERNNLIASKKSALDQKRKEEEEERRLQQAREEEEERIRLEKEEERLAKAAEERAAMAQANEAAAKRRELEDKVEAQQSGGRSKWGDRAEEEDRPARSGFGGGRFGGDRDREEGGRFGGGRSGFGGRGDREESGFRSNRGDREERSGFGGRGGDRDGSRWGRGGDREERSGFGSRGGDREEGGRWGRSGGDREERSGFGGRGGDREERSGFGGRGGDREAGGRWGNRGGDREERSGFGGRGGDREERTGFGGRGGDRDEDRREPRAEPEERSWSRGKALEAKSEEPKQEVPASETSAPQEDDGFTTVSKKKKGGSRKKGRRR